MEASFFAAYNLPNLTEVRIYDNSVYDTVTPYDINATRLMFSTVNTRNNINENVSEIIAFKEYVVTEGSIQIGRIVYTTGEIIYTAQDYVISELVHTDDVVIAETGYYGIRSTFLPVDSYVSYTPSQMIYGQTGLYYSDNVVTLRYELYSTKYSVGAVPVSEETQFIVIGDPGGLIGISVERIYVGEVFTKDSGFTFTNQIGTNFVVKLEAETEGNFRTWYQNWTLWSSYFNTISTSYQVSQSFLAQFLGLTARINQCAMYENQNFNTSLQSVQDLMDDVNNSYKS